MPAVLRVNSPIVRSSKNHINSRKAMPEGSHDGNQLYAGRSNSAVTNNNKRANQERRKNCAQRQDCPDREDCSQAITESPAAISSALEFLVNRRQHFRLS